MDLKIKDVAELLNVSETTIRRWLSEGRIPAYRLNHQYRFSRTEIESWVMSQKLGTNYASTNHAEKKESPKGSIKAGIKQFSLYRAIHKGGVLYNVPGATKEEVIRAAMKNINKSLHLDGELISDLLMERENLQPTGLGNGIGIPHTRDYLLNTHQDLVIVVFPEQPLSYGSLDNKPVHTLFFLFACDDKRHLHLLAKIAHLSSIGETSALLEAKPGKEALLDYIKTWEGSIQKVQDEAITCSEPN